MGPIGSGPKGEFGRSLGPARPDPDRLVALQERDVGDVSRASTEDVPTVVRTGLACRGCGYDLRGIASAGHCPECGLEVWETIVATVDPAASSLPRLADPRGVANGMAWVTLGMFGAMTAIIAGPALVWIEGVVGVRPGAIAAWLSTRGALVAIGFLVIGTLAVLRIKPRSRTKAVKGAWQHVTVLGVGMLLSTVVLMTWYGLERTWSQGIAPGLAGDIEAHRGWIRIGLLLTWVLALVGFRGVIREVGRRSRTFRRARGGRQRVNTLIAGIGGVAVGEGLRLVALHSDRWDELLTVGSILAAISLLMVFIGLGYLTVNVWWIRRSLLRPPPRLRDLLVPVDDAGSPGPGRP